MEFLLVCKCCGDDFFSENKRRRHCDDCKIVNNSKDVKAMNKFIRDLKNLANQIEQESHEMG